MIKMKNQNNINIAIFMSSKDVNSISYKNSIEQLIQKISSFNVKVLVGNGSDGIAKNLCEIARINNLEILSIITPDEQGYEFAHEKLTVTTIADRKKLFYDLADLFIVLPGGLGTIDEFFTTLNELKFQKSNKKIALFNLDNFFNPILTFLDQLVRHNFLKQKHIDYLIIENDIDKLINKLELDQYLRQKLMS